MSVEANRAPPRLPSAHRTPLSVHTPSRGHGQTQVVRSLRIAAKGAPPSPFLTSQLVLFVSAHCVVLNALRKGRAALACEH